VADIVQKIALLHEALDRAALPHAFGGALALAWCTERARGTIDIDLNVFVPADRFAEVVGALPQGVRATRRDLDLFRREGQARLWWDKTPLDVFLNTTGFHEGLLSRVSHERFAGTDIPFLSCFDLAVFKAFFDRTKDWADLEAMQAAGTLDIDRVRVTLIEYLGASDERLVRLQQLGSF
jgi:hypothetical protein